MPRHAALAQVAPRGADGRARSRTVAAEPDDDPSSEALLADRSVSRCWSCCETLAPAERVAFVLHDMFAVPFDEIAPIVGRSADRGPATRQPRPPPRARAPAVPERRPITRQREVVDAFLAASRNGDFEGLLAVLDPDVVMRADEAAVRWAAGGDARCCGSGQAFKGRARSAQSALVDGAVGVVVAPRGQLLLVLNVTIANGRITAIEVTADPERLARLDLAILGA